MRDARIVLGVLLLVPAWTAEADDRDPPLTVTAPAEGRPTAGAQGELAACLPALARAWAAQLELEPQYLERASAKSLFQDRQAANPAAVKALGPALERVTRGQGDVTLECRAWACRALIIDALKSKHSWMAPLRNDAELAERTRGDILVEPYRKTIEALSDDAVSQWTVYLKLVEPSDRRIPRNTATMSFQVADPPPPSSAQDCRVRLAAVQTELAAMRATLHRDRSPAERWAAAEINRPLTDDTRARVRRALALAPATPDADIECRGTICRAMVSPALIPDDRTFVEKVWPHPELKTRLLGFTRGRPSYWKMRDVSSADGRELLTRRIAELEASPDFRRCQAELPRQGKLQVRFSVAGSRANPWSGDRVELEYLGRLADTPLGRCVASQAEAIVQAPPLPPEVSAAAIYRTYQFVPSSSAPSPR